MQYWRTQLLFYSIIAMMGSLFWSRTLLAALVIFFVSVSFLHGRPKDQLRQFIATPLLWGMSLLFFVPLVSGLWSSDKEQWLSIIRIKLPLLFLPLSFAGPILFSKKQWNSLAFIFVIAVLAGTAWSIFHYAADSRAVNEAYLKAKSLITPLNDDHVRFSWMVSMATFLSGWLYIMKRKKEKTVARLLLIITTWFIVYLHLLAARTGLFSFYIGVGILVVWFMLKKMRWQYSAVLLVGLIVLPFLAYYTLPTFQNRVRYFKYDLGYFKKAHYLPGANDAVRVISLKAGWNIMQDHPLTGVGFGDLMTETKKWYHTEYPEMQETDQIYPSSEWLLYGAGCGIPGLCLFVLAMCTPFFAQVKDNRLWWILNGTAAFSFLGDIGLEVQFGVFIYSFIVLWWWKWLKEEKIESL